MRKGIPISAHVNYDAANMERDELWDVLVEGYTASNKAAMDRLRGADKRLTYRLFGIAKEFLIQLRRRIVKKTFHRPI